MDERAGHYDIGIGEIGAAKPGGRTKLLHRVQASARLRQATLFPVGADMGGAVKMALVDHGGDFSPRCLCQCGGLQDAASLRTTVLDQGGLGR